MTSTTIVIDHLTRMRHPYVCVAGLSADGLRIRPQRTGHRRWERTHTGPGRPFELGAVVDLGPTQPAGSPPAIEDHIVLREERMTRRGRLPAPEFFDLVKGAAHTSLYDLFGDSLAPTGKGTASVPPGSGPASLGALRLDAGGDLALSGGAVHLEFEDLSLGRMRLRVTDLRLTGPDDHAVPGLFRVAAMRLSAGEPVVLSVGLSRLFEVGGLPAHWLQVNNLHFPTYLDEHPAFRTTGR